MNDRTPPPAIAAGVTAAYLRELARAGDALPPNREARAALLVQNGRVRLRVKRLGAAVIRRGLRRYARAAPDAWRPLSSYPGESPPHNSRLLATGLHVEL